MGMREEFEAYRDSRNALLESEGHKPGSKWHVTQAHYATWEASRAALVVTLPQPAVAGSSCYRIHAVTDALTDAGVSYK